MKATRTQPTPQTAKRPTQPRRAWHAGIAAAGIAAIALLVAGCGGGSPSSDVAHLGSSISASTSSSTPAAASGEGSGVAQARSQAVAYAACMRAHGIANFPEPQVSGNGNEVRVRMVAPASSVRGNPKFKSAQQVCGKLMPGGGPSGSPAPPISPQEQSQYLKAAACIRSHGIPSFPDPTFSGGGVHLPKTAGVNPRSPQVRAAEEACQSLIPGGLHGNH
jgi:hypothetical protein